MVLTIQQTGSLLIFPPILGSYGPDMPECLNEGNIYQKIIIIIINIFRGKFHHMALGSHLPLPHVGSHLPLLKVEVGACRGERDPSRDPRVGANVTRPRFPWQAQ